MIVAAPGVGGLLGISERLQVLKSIFCLALRVVVGDEGAELVRWNELTQASFAGARQVAYLRKWRPLPWRYRRHASATHRLRLRWLLLTSILKVSSLDRYWSDTLAMA